MPLPEIAADDIPRNVDIYKEKIPAGWSYALRPARLEGAVADAGLLFPVSLHQLYKVWAIDAPAFSATFHPRGSYLGAEVGRISVHSYAIPAEQRHAQRAFVEAVFLPELISWIRSIETLPLESPIGREEQNFSCEGSSLALPKRAIPNIPKGQPRRK